MEQEEIEAKLGELAEKVTGYEKSLEEKDALIVELQEKVSKAEEARQKLSQSMLQEIDNRIPTTPMSEPDSLELGALKTLIPKYYPNTKL